jgi:hypothetical protein
VLIVYPEKKGLTNLPRKVDIWRQSRILAEHFADDVRCSLKAQTQASKMTSRL